jgi:predicted Zn finger-like uncharacterized protein
MYSQCPECLTRFRVSAAALRAARGTVRCGRCGSAFDAVLRLSDTLPSDEPASALDEPVPPGATSAGGIEGATAVGLLASGAGASVPEFHFSADDIERVFVDGRDWQSRFGAPPSPGDQAGLRGNTSSAELVGFLREGDTGEEDASERDANNPPVLVHEPESIEDITLEGERIQIEGIDDFQGFEEDFLEREIQKEIDEQHLAEISGSYRGLPASEVAAALEAVDPVEPRGDLDSAERIAPLELMPTAVTGTAAAITVESTPPVAPPVATPVVPPVATSIAAAQPAAAAPPAARWRRPPEPDDSFEIDELDHRLAEDLAAAASERGSRWAWGIGALLLALLLSMQLAHRYRLPLARDATVGPALREVYSRLGRPLPPNWNLAAFELRQWGASGAAPSAAGTMTVRASLKNGAAFAQPMPLLRLELEDRFGGTVARRDFRPAEYLKDPAQATRLLPAGASTEAELAIVGTTMETVGYRLDVCLPEDGGVVRCAEPARARPPSSTAPQ